MGELPEFEAPEWDKRAVRAKQQAIAGPGIRALRQQVQAAAGRSYDNPNVRRAVLRDTLQGYGIGMGSVMQAAGRQAFGEYSQEYQSKYQERLHNFNAQIADLTNRFQAAYSTWKLGVGSETTTKEDRTYSTPAQMGETTSMVGTSTVAPSTRQLVPLGGWRSGVPGGPA